MDEDWFWQVIDAARPSAPRCLWVVGRGQAFWESVASGRSALREAAQLYSRDPEPRLENVTNPALRGYAAPGSLAAGVYWTRFGEILDDGTDLEKLTAEPH